MVAEVAKPPLRLLLLHRPLKHHPLQLLPLLSPLPQLVRITQPTLVALRALEMATKTVLVRGLQARRLRLRNLRRQGPRARARRIDGA